MVRVPFSEINQSNYGYYSRFMEGELGTKRYTQELKNIGIRYWNSFILVLLVSGSCYTYFSIQTTIKVVLLLMLCLFFSKKGTGEEDIMAFLVLPCIMLLLESKYHVSSSITIIDHHTNLKNTLSYRVISELISGGTDSLEGPCQVAATTILQYAFHLKIADYHIVFTIIAILFEYMIHNRSVQFLMTCSLGSLLYSFLLKFVVPQSKVEAALGSFLFFALDYWYYALDDTSFIVYDMLLVGIFMLLTIIFKCNSMVRYLVLLSGAGLTFWHYNEILINALLFHIEIVYYWVGCLVAMFAITFTSIPSKNNKTIIVLGHIPIPKTIYRKMYHIVVVVMFVPLLSHYIDFIYMSLMLAIALFFIFEIGIRYPSGSDSQLTNQLRKFTDERDDTRPLILTHIYLLVGIAMPILFAYPYTKYKYAVPHSFLLSGLISLGIGDTVASLVGCLCGENRWNDRSKTFEGSIACFFACFFSFYILDEPVTLSTFSFLAIAFIATLYEAFTYNIDNLTLPLVTMFAHLVFI